MTTSTPNQSISSVKDPSIERSDSQLVLGLYRRLGSWEAVTDALGHSPGFWWKVAHGKIRKPVSGGLRRCLTSSDPKLLRLIQQGAVPWLRDREGK